MKVALIDMAHLFIQCPKESDILCARNCAKWMKTQKVMVMDEKPLMRSYISARRGHAHQNLEPIIQGVSPQNHQKNLVGMVGQFSSSGSIVEGPESFGTCPTIDLKVDHKAPLPILTHAPTSGPAAIQIL